MRLTTATSTVISSSPPGMLQSRIGTHLHSTRILVIRRFRRIMCRTRSTFPYGVRFQIRKAPKVD